jgi:hypothetical protein
MKRIASLRFFAMATLLACALAPLGCNHNHATGFAPPSAAALSDARLDIAAIPLPAKNLALPWRDESQWRNPFLSVNGKMLLLRIYLPDANPSALDRGGITRSTNARKQELSIRLRDLPRALAALPPDCWPYGRVVAVTPGFLTPQNQALLQHNEQVTLQTLHALGVVAEDWAPGTASLP